MKTEIDEVFEYKDNAEFSKQLKRDFLLIAAFSFLTGGFIGIGVYMLINKILES